MGILTEDFSRLVSEIQGSRNDRREMARDLRRNTAERKREVQMMQAGFHAAHAKMSRNQGKALRDFAAGIGSMVSGTLKEFSDDLGGASRAWRGMYRGQAIFKKASRSKGQKEEMTT